MANSIATAISGHISVVDGQPTTTTQDIADVYGKRHDHVLNVVRQRMSEAGEWGIANFRETPYTNPQNGQTYLVIRMTKKGFHFVVGKFTGAKAVRHQIAFADEFERMEAALRKNAPAQPSLPGFSDAERMEKAFALAEEAAAGVSRAVFKAVMSNPSLPLWTRFLMTLDGGKPFVAPIEQGSIIATLSRLAEMIVEPGGMLPSNAELANLAAACNERLALRFGHAKIKGAKP